MATKEIFQLANANIPSSDDHQLLWLLTEQVRMKEVGVLGNNNSLLTHRKHVDGLIGSLIPVRQITRVNRFVPRCLT